MQWYARFTINGVRTTFAPLDPTIRQDDKTLAKLSAQSLRDSIEAGQQTIGRHDHAYRIRKRIDADLSELTPEIAMDVLVQCASTVQERLYARAQADELDRKRETAAQ